MSEGACFYNKYVWTIKLIKMKKTIIAVALLLTSMAGLAQNFRANLDESVKPVKTSGSMPWADG